ncbi:hypothetical protein [uncultured Ruminococcus sp.]|uniref:hypothetical protein n=1 Tax=uncultured Ruminococcus sp. TaxID=165186 RepID=UPI0025E7BDA6|nr:hypothetical protein [uncultured Ruminococcus sp.]
MSNYIKAELYRITRGRSILGNIIICLGALVLAAGTFMQDLFHPNYLTVASTFPMMAAIISIAAGAAIGKHYADRTAQYEIMDGANFHKLIWYRLIVYISLLTVAYFIPVCAVMLIYEPTEKTLAAIGLFYIVFLRMLFSVIGITMTIKTPEGAMVPYARMMIENIFAVLGLATNEDKVFDMTGGIISVFKWFPSTECTLVANGMLDSDLIIKALIGFVIEAALMYWLAYTSYKKKWYVRTTIGGHV